MIESLFKQKSTIVRLQSGPLAKHLPFIAEALQQEQYPAERIRQYLRVVEKLGRWLCDRGLSIGEIDEAVIARYRTSLSKRANGQLRAAG